jgi:hypothetical protein
MNLLKKQTINSNLGRIDINSISQKTKVSSDFSSTQIDSLILMDSIHDGLCVNCDFRNECFWQKNNKVFCEHYQ